VKPRRSYTERIENTLKKFDSLKSIREILWYVKSDDRRITDAIKSVDGETLYRHCGQNEGHHHHLICSTCGLTITVEGPVIEDWTEKVAKENGFREVSHKVDIFGVCKSCAKK